MKSLPLALLVILSTTALADRRVAPTTRQPELTGVDPSGRRATMAKKALRLVLGLAATAAIGVAAQAADISGAGATFPYPIYAKWAQQYALEKGDRVNYQSIGSGGGIKQIGAKTVTFGATDMPLKVEELEKQGLTQFPMVIGGTVPVVNLKGIQTGQLKLDGKVLADIYLGKITKWNDPAIKALNADMELPNRAIAPVYRSDGSGTTYIFTHYLDQVSPEWKNVGVNTSVKFPVGIGGKGNEGVAAITSKTEGAIGYVEYAYAAQNQLPVARVQNRAGKWVEAESKSFQAAAAHADWGTAPGFHLLLTNQPGDDSWPITGATFILMHKAQAKPEAARQALDFFHWAYRKGGPMAEGLHFVPMPAPVVKLAMDSWQQIKGPDGNPIWTPPAD